MPTEYLLPFKPLFDQAYYVKGVLRKTVNTTEKNTKSKTKFTCLVCRQAAWGKPSLDINCIKCNQAMVVIDNFGKKDS